MRGLVGCGTPTNERSSRTCQWHDPTRPHAKDLQQAEQVWPEVAHGATLGHLEPENDLESSHGFSPFFLVYGAEAILPTDLEYGSPRLKVYQEQQNQQAREDSLDQVDEARDMVLLHSACYQQSLRWYQAQRVRRRDLNKGDLVLRLWQDIRGRHKLTPPWEGLYIIVEVLKPGTYKLANEKGEIFTYAWNIQQLRCFYP